MERFWAGSVEVSAILTLAGCNAEEHEVQVISGSHKLYTNAQRRIFRATKSR